jgi:mRNA interferase RelE/StbE
MFKLIYAKSVAKDLRKIASYNLPKIKEGIEELINFPNLPQIKHLKNHPVADYRLRIGNYRVLFDVSWKKKEIYILKIGHRRDIY